MRTYHAVALLGLIFCNVNVWGQTYTVQIRVGDQVWRDGLQEWRTDFYADLFVDGAPAEPSSQYYYDWIVYRNGQWIPWLDGQGNGINHLQGDGEVGWGALTRVTVSQVGVFSTTSEPIPVGKSGQPKEVFIYAKRNDNSDINTSQAFAYLGHWMGENWRVRAASSFPGDKKYPLTTGEDYEEYLSAEPFAISEIGEKFHHWNNLAVDVLNHNRFTILSTTNDLTARYQTLSGGITIRLELLDALGLDSGVISYADPWLADFRDNVRAGRYRNRGIEAPLKNFSSPLIISENYGGHDSTYKGVFLDQSGPPLWNPPYYSVGAPNPQTIGGFVSYFLKWDNSNPSQVEFQNPNAAQTGVVFKQANATAKARYKAHLGSSLATATSTNSQRKYMADEADFEIRSAFVYESANQVWLGDGFNGYVEQLVSMGTDAYSMPSLLVANGGMVLYWHEALDTLG